MARPNTALLTAWRSIWPSSQIVHFLQRYAFIPTWIYNKIFENLDFYLFKFFPRKRRFPQYLLGQGKTKREISRPDFNFIQFHYSNLGTPKFCRARVLALYFELCVCISTVIASILGLRVGVLTSFFSKRKTSVSLLEVGNFEKSVN